MSGWLQRTWHRVDALASASWTMVIPGAMAALLRLVLLPWVPIPYPATHDEFSHLLAADTFSHGRLTNPTHPLWHFFETMHELSIPTYASKYQPGQAFFLAFGQSVFGSPFIGNIAACLLFVTAVTWMLRAWIPPGLAILGGFFAAVAFGAGNFWMESYYGVAIGATGVALVLGAVARIRAEGRFRMAWPLAIGIVLLWFTRPFEGGFLVLAAGALLLFDIVRRRFPVGGSWRASGWRGFTVILATCAIATVAFQAYYDWRVTGKATMLPYLLHEQQYTSAPLLWFEQPRTPTLDANAVVRRYHQVCELEAYEKRRAVMTFGVVRPALCTPPAATRFDFKEKLKVGEIAVVLAALLVLAVLYRGDPVIRDLGFVLAVSALPPLMESQLSSRYLLAITVALIALTFRVIWLSRKTPVRALVLAGALFCGAAGNNLFRLWHGKADPFPLRRNRQRVEHEVLAQTGQHVVFVRYAAMHDPNLEWVFNSADIDGQQLIWARDLGDEQDRALVNYYPGRHFWLLDADAAIPEPTPYIGVATR